MEPQVPLDDSALIMLVLFDIRAGVEHVVALLEEEEDGEEEEEEEP